MVKALSRSASESRYLRATLATGWGMGSSTYLDGSSAKRARISVFFCTIRSNLMICRRSSCTVGKPEVCKGE
jgi:hypothetical protein